MIVSYHPCIVADRNALCAGRLPDEADRQIMAEADAVILPQGCSKPLYETAKSACSHVWPCYDARFTYPGKTGQMRLFQFVGLPHPDTEVYAGTAEYLARTDNGSRPPFSFPMVLKLDWGGEGETVFRIDDLAALHRWMDHMARWEKTGQSGFLLQRYVPCRNRTLRVAVIGLHRIVYWRRQSDPDKFHANLDKGGVIDVDVEPDIRDAALEAIERLCSAARIHLAGVDLLFSEEEKDPLPLFLEINYFFGRKGLGGSEAYFRLLLEAARHWVRSIGLDDAAIRM